MDKFNLDNVDKFEFAQEIDGLKMFCGNNMFRNYLECVLELKVRINNLLDKYSTAFKPEDRLEIYKEFYTEITYNHRILSNGKSYIPTYIVREIVKDNIDICLHNNTDSIVTT